MNSSKRRIIAVVAISAAATAIPISSPAGAGGPSGRMAKAIGTHGRSANALGALAGGLDPTFGGDGKVTTNFGSGEEVHDATIQADGKIVVAGCASSALAVARYATDGALDPSFGGDGRVTTDLTRRGGDCAPGVAVQADGKIVAAGHSGFGGPNGRFALVRYLPDGTLDSTFGGDGLVTTDFTPYADAASSIVIQADGRIVAAGLSGVFGTNTMFATARYNPDGTLDSTFSGDGRITTDFTPGDDGANAVAVQSDGKIVVAGGAGTEGQSPDTGFALARYNPDGTLDSEFGEGGQVTNLTTAGRGAEISGIAILTSGRILAAGRDGKGGCKPCGSDMSTSFALVQYEADGTIDPTFGHDGLVITPLSPKDDIAFDLAIQTDGKIVAAGDSGSNGRNPKFAVVRYTPDGTLDPTFGREGKVRTDFTPGLDSAHGVVLQSDGRMVVAGTSDYLGTRDRFALARYLSEPGSHRSPGSAAPTPTRLLGVLSPPASAAPWDLDPSFGSGGKVTTAFIGGSASASSLVVQPDGKIVAAGLTGLNDFAARNFALAQYNTDGSIDTGFGPARRK